MTEQEIMNLSGDELDDAVAIAQGWEKVSDILHLWGLRNSNKWIIEVKDFHPSTNGSQCMEIMEREKIGVYFCIETFTWYGVKEDKEYTYKLNGKTPNEAILRCFLLSKQ